MTKRVLVTGGAGFIGSHLVDSLLEEGFQVIVIDNFDPFYDRKIKEMNISNHFQYSNYRLIDADIRDEEHIDSIFKKWKPEVVVHLAAKAGVRPSVQDPSSYVEVNIKGTTNILNSSVKYGVQKVVFGSSSSVYGLNEKVPFSETDSTLQPASPYGATKVAGEALCKSYSNCYNLPIVALRFFTVYGPRQRPDLAIHKFMSKIINNEPITLFGDGSTSRDYTFVSDIVAGIRAAIEINIDGYEVFNLGNDQPIKLIDLVQAIEETLNKKAIIEWLPPQIGDVPKTWADLSKSRTILGYSPKTSIYDGLKEFKYWMDTMIKNRVLSK
jgi:UDP-glucuronate 4-epimerase